ncbi:Gamma-aminobutyric acid receptor subunit beta [Dirofilaria immitis]|nr:Gamma-aminobutyric acid receptor subunit beta [Dirofilaria immitis]
MISTAIAAVPPAAVAVAAMAFIKYHNDDNNTNDGNNNNNNDNNNMRNNDNGYTTADIDLFWGKDRKDQGQVVGFENISLPQFKPVGVYVRLYFEVLLARNLGFYLMNIIIPSMLIVTISWVSFWLNREASPARVGLGVTTVLTMTTLITTTNNAMPKSYQNMTLINDNYASPSKSSIKVSDRSRHVSSNSFIIIFSYLFTQMDTFLGSSGQNPNLSVSEALIPECDCRTIPLIQNPRLVTDHTLWPAPFMRPKRASRTCRSVTPSKIDKFSRFLFPMLFLAFNYGYTVATIHYHWCQLKDIDCKTAVKVEPFELTSYRFANLCINKTIATTSSGSYSRLWAQFLFEREFSFYMIQIYTPAILVVFISWVSFWINPESAPSRTVIGTLTILSETHLLMSTNKRLPPVSYIKAVDVYLGFCYLNVALALIEFATVQAPDLLRDVRIDVCTCDQNVSVFLVDKKSPKCNNCCIHSRLDLIARIAFPISSIARLPKLTVIAQFLQYCGQRFFRLVFTPKPILCPIVDRHLISLLQQIKLAIKRNLRLSNKKRESDLGALV